MKRTFFLAAEVQTASLSELSLSDSASAGSIILLSQNNVSANSWSARSL